MKKIVFGLLALTLMTTAYADGGKKPAKKSAAKKECRKGCKKACTKPCAEVKACPKTACAGKAA
ncbi:MAG: hypothetical protein JWP88_363 [Flaviaesturariibacter sp.]|nr:hypothetical protein [Flaviaesturariibacter sp.]